MLFQRRFHAGLADGSITLTFRRWATPRVKVGGVYRCQPIGLLEVDRIDAVRLGDVTEREAKRAGFEDRASLVEFLGRHGKGALTSATSVFRVELHHAGADDRAPLALAAELSADDLRGLAGRLDGMDRRSRHGSWTRKTLALIERHPRVPASRLARMVRRETAPFKADVRKLKKLGLTVSFEVGYELSPGGRTFLERSPRS